MTAEQLRTAVRVSTGDEQAANLAAAKRDLELMRSAAQRPAESV